MAKLLFWNVMVAGLLIHFGSDYVVRFWLTFGIMIMIAGTMLLKAFLAVLYYFYYKVAINNKKTSKKTNQLPGRQDRENRYRGTDRVTPFLYKCLKAESGHKYSL